MAGRELTHRIGRIGAPGHQERLAAAAAEIDLPPVAAPARFGHPFRSPEALEDRSVKPHFRERRLPHVGKFESSDFAGALTGQYVTVRSDSQEDPPPSIEACLGKLLKV